MRSTYITKIIIQNIHNHGDVEIMDHSSLRGRDIYSDMAHPWRQHCNNRCCGLITTILDYIQYYNAHTGETHARRRWQNIVIALVSFFGALFI